MCVAFLLFLRSFLQAYIMTRVKASYQQEEKGKTRPNVSWKKKQVLAATLFLHLSHALSHAYVTG